jgi:hypothetical protein
VSFDCDHCGQKTLSLVICGYCRQWCCYDCIEKEMTPRGPVLACDGCRHDRRKAIQRYPIPTCRICGWPQNVHGCDPECQHVPQPYDDSDERYI